MKQYRPRLNKEAYNLTRKGGLLIIGDLHAPFVRNGYLEFCKSIRDKYNCDEIIFIGDIIDNHYSSFHDTDPDGHGGAKELELAKSEIKMWYKEFPKAKVCLGNHDLIPDRKRFNANITKSWIRPISDVLETKNWVFAESFVIDDILYTHGTARKARQRAKNDLTSVVQGHYHAESYIDFYVGQNYKIFAMQIGCGIDDKAYAMAYGKNYPKNHINCGVIINGMPILEYMPL
jgi:metallophosphoesterase superfamily enzyme